MSKRLISFIITICIIISSFVVITASANSLVSLKSDSKLYLLDCYDGTYEILNFPENKTLEEFLSNFDNAEQIKAYKNGKEMNVSDKVCNGILILFNNEEATVIVKGDTTCDGIINSTDYLQIKSYFLGKYDFSESSSKAADCSDDNKIDSTDYMQIKRYLLKEFDLYPAYSENDSSDSSESSDISDFVSDTSFESSSDESSDESSEESSSEIIEVVYVLNVKSKKIHIPTCSGLTTMKPANRGEFIGDINELLEQGYSICGTCKAGQTN